MRRRTRSPLRSRQNLRCICRRENVRTPFDILVLHVYLVTQTFLATDRDGNGWRDLVPPHRAICAQRRVRALVVRTDPRAAKVCLKLGQLAGLPGCAESLRTVVVGIRPQPANDGPLRRIAASLRKGVSSSIHRKLSNNPLFTEFISKKRPWGRRVSPSKIELSPLG